MSTSTVGGKLPNERVKEEWTFNTKLHLYTDLTKPADIFVGFCFKRNLLIKLLGRPNKNGTNPYAFDCTPEKPNSSVFYIETK